MHIDLSGIDFGTQAVFLHAKKFWQYSYRRIPHHRAALVPCKHGANAGAVEHNVVSFVSDFAAIDLYLRDFFKVAEDSALIVIQSSRRSVVNTEDNENLFVSQAVSSLG